MALDSLYSKCWDYRYVAFYLVCEGLGLNSGLIHTRKALSQLSYTPNHQLIRVYRASAIPENLLCYLLGIIWLWFNEPRQRLTIELLKATGGCEVSQRPTDLCLEWLWMGTRALWDLLRGWAPPWLLIVAGPWAHLGGKDRHWYWVHSSPSESSSFGISNRLAARKESCYILAELWLAGVGWGARLQGLG